MIKQFLRKDRGKDYGEIKKKIVLPILGIFVIVCIIGIILWNRQDFHLIKDTLTLEYGETLPNQFDDFIETNGDIEYSSQDIDDFEEILDVGDYTIDFQLGNKKETLYISVEDTTSPQLQLREEVTALQNHTIDYEECLSIQDLSEYETTIIDDDVNDNTPGKYVAKAIVKDEYQNQSTIDIPVTIEEVTLKASNASMTLKPNETQTLKVTTNSHHAITYASSNPDVVTVDEAGHISALKAGTATISATVDGHTQTCHITVPSTQKKSTTSSHHTTHHSSTNRTTQSSNTNIGETVYITKTGSKYHRAGCRYLRKSQIEISLSEAKNEGYTACSVCF